MTFWQKALHLVSPLAMATKRNEAGQQTASGLNLSKIFDPGSDNVMFQRTPLDW